MHNFPPQPTNFIGRSEEISEISILLGDPTCRLLTITGPGGIGKTRLAIELAARAVGNFTEAAFFVPLQPVEDGDLLVQAIADAIGYSLSGSQSPRAQLLNYLHDKTNLLVLDNFEQLLPRPTGPEQANSEQGLTLLNEILHSAPNVKLLVTSREILNVQSEWVYAVDGMFFPRGPHIDDLEKYSAVNLFVDRAKRIRPGFSLGEEQEHVVKICQLVDGMPLALELSASWIKTLECAEIAAELQKNLDLLATRLRDVPDRHQNMQAVFEHSWQLLQEEEQDSFKRLSIFRGGFQRLAAEKVAGATLPVLSALVDKSLLRLDATGRYQMHELLRQYAEEQLHHSLEEAKRIRDDHCVFFAGFLSEKLEEILNGEQREATLEIKSEVENVRAAWQWAVESAKVEEIHKSIGALLYFFQYQGRYFEGTVQYGNAIDSITNLATNSLNDLTLAELLDGQGWLFLRLGQLDRAKEALEESLSIYQRLEVPPARRMGTEPRTALGVLANIQGDYEKAVTLGEEAYRLSEAQANGWNMMFALYVLTNASLAKGNALTAREYARQAYAISKNINDSWFRAFILNDLGSISFALGEYTKAQEFFQASYDNRKEFDDPGGMAEAMTHLGRIAVSRKEYAKAENTFRESLAMYRDINDKGGLATTLESLGVVALATGDYQAAGGYFHEAIQIAHEIQYLPLVISIAVNIGELFYLTKQIERSVELLTAVFHHPAIGGEQKKSVEELLGRCQSQAPAEVFESAEQNGLSKTGTEALFLILAAPGLFLRDVARQALDRPESKDLVEPLTARELEVVRLIAEGLANKQIAEELVITLGTVKWYNNQIFNKLNVTNRTQAAARARDLNLLPQPSLQKKT